METYGSEIGQKMRSAVKAKLVELGTASQSGYIDDELPDYVMVMVANKRSKQQMLSDLNLFLGTRTELFVTWLHEVLQKLQEVTLPAAAAVQTKKHRSSHKEDAATAAEKPAKKDKKASKKERKQRETAHETQETVASSTTAETQPAVVPVITSITDVFAEELLEKAKKDLDLTADASLFVKKGKSKKSDKSKQSDFDIPTISEISSTSGTVLSGDRAKDLAELAEIQKKIYAAKKHLKSLASAQKPDTPSEEEDEDFITLNDGHAADFGEATSENVPPNTHTTPTEPAASTSKAKSPIVFDKSEDNDFVMSEEEELPPVQKRPNYTPPRPREPARRLSAVAEKTTEVSEHRKENNAHVNERKRAATPNKQMPKRPVHERLGCRPSTSETAAEKIPERRGRERREKELYVPAHRRKEMENLNKRAPEPDRRRRGASGAREREQRERRARERTRSRSRSREQRRAIERNSPRNSSRRRSVSRVNSSPRSTRRVSRTPTRRNSRTPIRRASPSPTRKASRTPTRKQNTHFVHSQVEAILNKNKYSTGADEAERTQRQRIVSRVIKATNKQPEPSDDEDLAEKPVNSVIKVKPRQRLSPSKQACKTLLLRAVADAQRSTVLAKPQLKEESKHNVTVTVVGGSTKIYTKGYRERLKREVPASIAQKIVISMEEEQGNTYHEDSEIEEYVPQSIKQRLDKGPQYAYGLVTRTIDSLQQELEEHSEIEPQPEPEIHWENNEEEISPKFVVTLTDEKVLLARQRQVNRRKRPLAASPPPEVSSSSTVVRLNHQEATSTTQVYGNRRSRSQVRRRAATARVTNGAATKASLVDRLSSPTNNTLPANSRPTDHEQEFKKIIIRNDTEDEEQSSNEALQEDKSLTPPLPHHQPQSTEYCLKKRITSKQNAADTAQRAQSPLDRKPQSPLSRRSRTRSRSPLVKNNATSLQRARSPLNKRSLTPLRRSRSPAEKRSYTPRESSVNNPFKRRSRTPVRLSNRMNSPLRRRSRTPPLRRRSDSRSPFSRRSRTPMRRRSRSPLPRRARTPSSRRSRSPARRLSRTPMRSRSRTPPARRSRTPLRLRLGSLVKSGFRSRSRERSRSPLARAKHLTIRYDTEKDEKTVTDMRGRQLASSSKSAERARSPGADLQNHKKISIRNVEAKKYDNIPALSSITIDSSSLRNMKTKERCKYHPNCTKHSCDFYHPSAPCKAFPNCKFADKCLYSHPKCKFDMNCTNADCLFSHSGIRNPLQLQPVVPPLSSHVVPVQNYKSISTAGNPSMCKFYPNCTKLGCPFFHPKPCRFGKNCVNQLECSFYHVELQSSSKFKWVSTEQ